MLWFLPLAYADIPASARWLATENVAVGIFADASLVNETAGVGLLFDPDGPAGPTPLGNDLLMEGDEYEAWSIEYTATNTEVALLNGGPETTSTLTFAWDAPVDGPSLSWIHGVTATVDAEFDAWIELSTERDVLWMRLDITAVTPLADVRLMRAADPDPDVFVSSSASTDNDAGITDGVAYARGVGPATGKALVLAVSDGTSGLCRSCSWAEDVEGASQGPTSGDLQLAVAASLGDVPADTTTTLTFVYALSDDPEDALALALAAATDLDHDGDGVETPTDCDDRDDRVYPDATEAADGLDNDCDGEIDEASAVTDDDGDGYTEAEGDCDDGDATVHPGASASGTAADADCDGVADGEWAADVPEDEDAEVRTGSHPSNTNGCSALNRTPNGQGWLVCALALGAARRRRAS